MLNVDVIASSINNLSDARYFAAYGVQWMTFPTSRNADNIGQIKEIIDWCEGPRFAVELTEEDPEYLGFLRKELQISGVLVEDDASWITDQDLHKIVRLTQEELPELGTYQSLIFNPTQHPELLTTEQGQMYIDCSVCTLEEVKSLYTDHPSIGWVLYGEEEEKVGLKSFDQQDELIDLLMD